MRLLTLMAGLLLCVACSSVPAPTCGAIDYDCNTTEIQYGGLALSETVQLMVQSPMLIGGKPADPAEWPASVYAMADGAACSATIVGDRVLFMAAHCMPNGGVVNFTAHANNYKAFCMHHPEYRKNSTADWALCLVDRPVIGVAFEVLGINEGANVQLYPEPTVLTLSGYGCTNPGGGGGNDGIFRTGLATVVSLPSTNTYDIVTKGGAALCFGDSGGAAYYVFQDGSRAIIGVNSRGNIKTMSYLPAVFADTFANWADGWAKDSANVRICGLHSDALGCRSGVPLPQPDGKFEVQTKAACVKGVVKQEYLSRKAEIVTSVRNALLLEEQ